ncbi:MAG TPA: cytochrome c [Gemmatimonadales bacterium]|jgi:mono/diheme cytochrome c family protein|nr:cytochrome c [Gemmatimonadales bacterium]
MRKLLGAFVLLGLGGCNYYYNEIPSPDDVMHHISWFDHMILSKAVHPYQRNDIPRDTPAGAVPVGGGEADWHKGDPLMMSFAFDTLVANKLKRPAGPPAPGTRSGQAVYNIYCSACHGYTGDADAPASKLGVFALSLLTAEARNFTDGYIYSMIRYGRGRMPQYGDKIVRRDERWAVVDYVRQLQSKAPLPPPPAKGAH